MKVIRILTSCSVCFQLKFANHYNLVTVFYGSCLKFGESCKFGFRHKWPKFSKCFP